MLPRTPQNRAYISSRAAFTGEVCRSVPGFRSAAADRDRSGQPANQPAAAARRLRASPSPHGSMRRGTLPKGSGPEISPVFRRGHRSVRGDGPYPSFRDSPARFRPPSPRPNIGNVDDAARGGRAPRTASPARTPQGSSFVRRQVNRAGSAGRRGAHFVVRGSVRASGSGPRAHGRPIRIRGRHSVTTKKWSWRTPARECTSAARCGSLVRRRPARKDHRLSSRGGQDAPRSPNDLREERAARAESARARGRRRSRHWIDTGLTLARARGRSGLREYGPRPRADGRPPREVGDFFGPGPVGAPPAERPSPSASIAPGAPE